jgi:Na+/H+-dicarboxylate symporter
MKTMKLIMRSMCLAVFCTSAAWVEYKIVSSLGSLLGLFALTSMSAAVLVALLRAPEGYENADGFYARVPQTSLAYGSTWPTYTYGENGHHPIFSSPMVSRS